MRVRSSLRRSLTALVGALLLAATILPAAVLATEPDPSAGYHATATVTRPDDSVRTDGSIAVGDDLSIVYAAVDGTNILKCFISVVTVGSSVQVPVYGSQGECRFSMRLPELQSEAWRALSDDPGRELCVVATLWFADSEERAMVESDRLQPGGSTCGEGGPFRDYQEKLEFHIDAAGATDRPFVSDPQFLSWDPTDWGTDMQPLRFGEDWTFALPDWVSSCRTFINGTWQTSITAQHGDSCADWHVRIPGILPAAMPFSGDDEWHTSLVAQYSVPGQDMMFSAIGFTTVPLESSDGVFESDLPAVFPTDLAKTRFVTIGEAWTPSFQVSGVTATSCHLEVHVNQAADVLYDVAPNDAGICTFDVPAMVQGEFHQYHVYAVPEDDPSNNEINFGGNISAIPAPEPPVIETPTLEAGGDTGLDVEAGDGQGLAVDLEVTAETPAAGAAAATTTSGRTTAGTTLASPVATPVCTDQAVSTDLEVGGAIPTLEALCDLAPGSYVATATMVDAAGVTSTAHRTFSVPYPRPAITARTPAPSAIGVARDARPSVTFDIPVTGVSSASMRLLDVSTGTYLPGTVSYDAGTRRATLAPAALLGTSHTFRLYLSSAIHSVAGSMAITATNWSFKVTADGTAPTIIGRTPAPGAMNVSRSVVPAVRFSEAVKGLSATNFQLRDSVTNAYVPGTLHYDTAQHRASLDPTGTLVAGRTYVVIVRSTIRDLAGNGTPTTTWSFTTSASPSL